MGAYMHTCGNMCFSTHSCVQAIQAVLSFTSYYYYLRTTGYEPGLHQYTIQMTENTSGNSSRADALDTLTNTPNQPSASDRKVPSLNLKLSGSTNYPEWITAMRITLCMAKVGKYRAWDIVEGTSCERPAEPAVNKPARTKRPRKKAID